MEVELSDRKSLTVHYRRLEDPVSAFNGTTLEAAVREAIAHDAGDGAIGAHWKSRAWNVPPSQEETYLMNLFHDDGQSFFGDLTQYTRGFMQALLNNETDAPMLAVEQRPPPQGREYIHSMMHWMAIGNHLLTIQSRSLTTKSLEQYLTWLLNEKTGVIGGNGHVILNAKFDKDQMGGDLDDVSEIVVGGTASLVPEEAPSADQVEEVEQYSDMGARRPWGERALEVLRAVMRSEADVQELLKSIPKEADLDVSVRIGYKSRKKRLSRAPMQHALRNLPEGEITARGRFGKTTGKDIRLSFPVRILSHGSLLEPEDVRAKLRSAYDYFVENGKIDQD